MKKNMIITILLFTTIGASTYGMYQSKEVEKQAVELTEQQDKVASIEEEINKVAKESEDKNLRIKELESALKESKANLDSARQRIEEITRKVVFNPDNVTIKSGATDYHMAKALKGTGLAGEAGAFVKAEKEYGVNAYFLAAIAAQESSWGGSDRAKNQNNLTGHAVYNTYSRGSNFDSRSQSILDTAKLLRDNYLNPKGENFNGLSVEGVNTDYCLLKDMKTTDPKWGASVSEIASDLVNKTNA